MKERKKVKERKKKVPNFVNHVESRFFLPSFLPSLPFPSFLFSLPCPLIVTPETHHWRRKKESTEEIKTWTFLNPNNHLLVKYKFNSFAGCDIEIEIISIPECVGVCVGSARKGVEKKEKKMTKNKNRKKETFNERKMGWKEKGAI